MEEEGKLTKFFESKQNETSHSDKLQETATITQKAVESTINNNNSNRTREEQTMNKKNVINDNNKDDTTQKK